MKIMRGNRRIMFKNNENVDYKCSPSAVLSIPNLE